MVNVTWQQALTLTAYTDDIIIVTDMDNMLYIGKNGQWLPVVQNLTDVESNKGNGNQINE